MLRICVLVGCAALLAPAGASASPIFGDTDVTNPTLKVDGSGTALVQYTTKTGLQRRILVWGAVDALPTPDGGRNRSALVSGRTTPVAGRAAGTRATSAPS